MTRLITGPDIGQSQDSSARTIVTQQPKVEPWANSNIGTQTLMEFTYLTVIKGIPDFSPLPKATAAFLGEI